MYPIKSSKGQIGHVVCGTTVIMCSRFLLPSVPVLQLSILAFTLSVVFGIVSERVAVLTIPVGLYVFPRFVLQPSFQNELLACTIVGKIMTLQDRHRVKESRFDTTACVQCM